VAARSSTGLDVWSVGDLAAVTGGEAYGTVLFLGVLDMRYINEIGTPSAWPGSPT
jgi:hypothetical protein